MQVFDLKDVKPSDFVQYGLACLEHMADLGDQCAKETRDKLRVMVLGLSFVSFFSYMEDSKSFLSF